VAVGAAMLQRAVMPYVRRGGTCVMALNQLHLLGNFDHVVVLGDGGVQEQGSYAQLMQSEGELHRLITSLEISEVDLGEGSSPKNGAVDETTKMEAVEEEKGKSELSKEEKGNTDAVSSKVVLDYVKAAGYPRVIFSLVLCACAYGLMVFQDRWLAKWVEESQDDPNLDNTVYIWVYVGANLLFVVCMVLSSFGFAYAGHHAGLNLHSDVLARLLRAPVSFYEVTPSGRILSRMISDIANVDQNLIGFFDAACNFVFTLLALFILIIVIVPIVAVAVIVSIMMYGMAFTAADRTNRQVKRLANNRMSAVMASVFESSQGRLLINSSGCQHWFTARFDTALNNYSQAAFISAALVHWSMNLAYFVTFIIACATSVLVVYQRDTIGASTAGLALTYSFVIPFFLQMLSFCLTLLMMYLTALERLLQYSGTDSIVPQEPPWEHAEEGGASPKHADSSDVGIWPTKGAIEFEDVSLRYREGLPPALNGLSLAIHGGEKVGVVGRTGAGKSSMMMCLFRINDPFAGRVRIDGRNIQTLGLHTLRKAMGIIPQHPLLLAGTIRYNLDPFNKQDDAALVKCLGRVGLSADVLDTDVGEAASSLSAGQKQLITFARVLLSDAKIVCMDEPTSSIDAETDEAIHRMVEEEFRGRTVVTIAHRLHSVMTYDRIAVLGAGKLLEVGSPQELLAITEGHFASMARSMGNGADSCALSPMPPGVTVPGRRVTHSPREGVTSEKEPAVSPAGFSSEVYL